MPHLTIEYSANLTESIPDTLLADVNHMLAASRHFSEVDIKSRAYVATDFMIGTRTEQRAFIHAQLAIMQGRDTATQQAMSQTVLTGIQAALPAQMPYDLQITVNVVEMATATYAKTHRPANA